MADNVVPLFGSPKTEAKSSRLNPEKLKKARRASGLTQTDLAKLVGLTRQAISSFEQGSRSPDFDNFQKISSVLGQPHSYFLSAELETFGPLSARTFRAFGPATNRRNDQCLVFTEWAAGIASYISGFVDFPEPQVPSVSQPADGEHFNPQEIENAALCVRKAWGLGLGPIGNLMKLLESRGIFITEVPVTTGQVNAFSFWSGSKPFIVVGSEKTTAVRRRFDLAHELGHLILHQGISEQELENKNFLKQVESEANRFAGAFLLPFQTYPNEVFSTKLTSFIPLKERWKVAISAQIYRCSNLEIFTESQVLNLRKQLSAKRWRTREPLDELIEIECPTLLRKATELAVNSGVLEASDILADLNLNASVIANALGLNDGFLIDPNPAIFNDLSIRE